ncbi:MAG: succinylglutamate desuccinylase/aspartoacylase family protein [Rhodobacteraceae bacterium]|nr:succinylglutamate desuccinylase/aspartoacylase family protein [Paracoccaceae bacterium]
MTDSLVTAEVDFNALGKQTGFLRIPHSVHHSAYGWVPAPIVVIKNGVGPTVLLMAGNHGDEYEGQIALARLARDLSADDIQGRVIILTMANPPAARAGLRTSPIDAGNLNRSFPGNAQGTPTEMIAHYIEDVLMPLADISIDLHSGGTSLYYPATLLRGMGNSADESAMLTRLQSAFDLPYAWVFTGGGGRNSTARTAMGAANRKGVPSVMAELGGGGFVTPNILHQTERGLRRVLHSLGMLPDYIPDQANGTREVNALGLVYAYEDGVLELLVNIGDAVSQNDIVALIHHPQTPWKDVDEVRTPYGGMILCKRALGQVERGDAVFQIAKDVET